jgi:hypothetical protein
MRGEMAGRTGGGGNDIGGSGALGALLPTLTMMSSHDNSIGNGRNS